MFFFAVSGLINAVASTLFGLIAYFKNPNNPKNKIYAFYCLTLSIWSYCYFFWQISTTQSAALFFSRALMMGAILIPVAHYHHILRLFDLPSTKFLKIGYWLAIIYLLSNFTPLFISRVEPRHYFPFWPVPGPLFHPYLIGFMLHLGLALYTIFKVYNSQRSEIKNQLLYVIIATALGYGGGSTNFPLWYNINIAPWGNACVTIYTSTVFYILVRYKLLDITLVTRDFLVYTMTCLIFSIPFVALAMAVQAEISAVAWSLYALTVIFLPLTHPVLQQKIEPWIDKIVFREKFSYLKDFYALGREIPQVTNLKEFLPAMARKLSETAKVEWCRVLLIEGLTLMARFQGHYAVDHSKQKEVEWSNDLALALLNKLKRDTNIHFKSELLSDEGIKPLMPPDLDIEMVAPLFAEGKTFGLIALGPKLRSSAMFNQRDMEALQNIASAVAPILWTNFAFYEQTIKVEEGLHDSLNFLLSVDILAQQHQSHPSIMEQLENARGLLTDLRLTNQITIRKQRGEKLKSLPYSIKKVIENVCVGERLKAQAKGLSFELQMSSDLPEAVGDPASTKRIIENVVHNAVKYTRAGEIKVKAGVDRDFIKINCQDTGPGIPQEDLKYLFEAFYRAAGQRLEEGTGLGLHIVKELIEAQGGSVEVESQVGIGTVFHLFVPKAK